MRIAVIGGESTGKTTLAAAVSSRRGLTVLAPLKAELLERSGYHTLFEWAAATRGWARLLELQLERERAASASAIIDDGAIQIYCMVQRWGWNTIAPDRFEQYRNAAVELARTYDVVVLTPARLVGGPAPGRFRSAAHNEQLVRLIRAFAFDAELGERLLVLNEGAPEQQLERVLGRL